MSFLVLASILQPDFAVLGRKYKKMKKERILDYVFNEFATYGIKRVSVDDIAQKMHISKKTIYDLFINKEELLLAAVEYKFGKILDTIAKIPQKEENVLYLMVQGAVMEFNFFNTISPVFYKDINSYPRLMAYFEQVKMYIQERGQKLFLRGIKDGYIREDSDYKIVGRLLKSQVLSSMRDEGEEKYTPTQICFYSMITILRGTCTEKGVAVLEEIKRKGL